MESENTNENKKKQKIVLLIGLVTLLIAVLGATYAYFQISTNTDSSNTNITGSTPPKSLVTLTQGTSNLHLNISANDMSLANATKEYYATDVEEKAYEENEENGTKTIAQVELTGEETTKYSCTAKLTVSKVTEPDEEKDTMIEVLQPEDMILQFKGNIINEQLDLSELKENNPKEYNLSFKMTGNTTEEIQAYIKLLNKNKSQNYLSGKKLNIDISTSELKCNVFIPDPKIAELRADDEQGYLSEELQGGMYRYQAAPADETEAAQMTNWICFGTNSKDECIDTTDSDDNSIPDGIDKYMYRIVGITEEGEMKLIKETFVKRGTTNTFAWNSGVLLYACLNGNCDWANANIYKRLNGISGSNAIFVNNTEYEYMAQGTDWYNLIEEHKWMYGDTNETKYNGDEMYAIETGKTSTKRYWPDEEQGQTTCSSSLLCTEKEYTWSESINAKIGLMYIHDVNYAYPGGESGEFKGCEK